jgi:predicted MFS family arabinose efflux permease
MMFLIYSGIAVAIALIYSLMNDLDISKETPEKRGENRGRALAISPENRRTVAMLSLLFSMDAFGGGFVLQSILTLWFNSVHHFDLRQLSWIFFASGIITATSVFLAERISKRIGLLNTMVFTHLPSSIFLILIPFTPSPYIAVSLLFARQSISQMDVPTRQSYMMAIIKPEDRTATGAITNISRTAAQGISPPIATSMMAASLYTLPFVFGGGFKIAYDILIYFTFRKVKPPEEKAIEDRKRKEAMFKREKRLEKGRKSG